MKKIITTILIIFIWVSSYAQSVIIRSTATITPLDVNLFTQNSFRFPVFDDTTAANAVIALDSCGKQFYNRGTASMWYRACIGASSRKWIEISVSSSPTVSAWLTRGNDLSGQSLPNRLGTKNGDGLNIITNDLIRMTVPVNGLVRSSSAQNKYVMIDTVGKELYYGDASGGSGWDLLGNAGTTAGTNFVGTTDAVDLVFKRNSVEGLRLQSGVVAITGNMSLTATSSSATGVIFKGSNYFMHDFKLAGTNGDNTFIGNLSGNFTMTGSSGIQGSYNTGVGNATLYQNTTGFRNAAFGTYALQNNTTGFNNNGFGQSALQLNSDGYNNSAFGTRALLYNTSGHSNNAHGTDALFANTTGIFNSGFSIDALYQNTTGSYNSAFGDSTFWIGTIGIKNSGFGSRAGYYLGDTYPNFASVKDSMVTFLGADASRDSSISNTVALKNLTVIGYNAKGYASNQVVLGNTDVTTTLLRGNVGIGSSTPVALLTLGTAGTTLGSFSAAGNTSGVITFNPQAASGTYNWNWPTTAGSSGNILASGGGGASPITWYTTTGTGTVVAMQTAPTFITSITSPLIIGGTGTTSTLTYKTTTGVGAAGADHIWLVGNNGATEAMRILNSGEVGIGIAAPTSTLHVSGSLALKYLLVEGDNYTILASDYTLSVNNGANNWTIILPDAATCFGRIYIIKRFDNNSTGTITVDAESCDVQSPANGSFNATFDLTAWGTQNQSVMWQSNGTNWEAIK